MSAMEEVPEVDAKQQLRQKTFKKTLDPEEGRRSREETTVQIRKQKKDSRLKQRRFAGGAGSTSSVNAAQQGSPSSEASVQAAMQAGHQDPLVRQRLEQLPSMVAGVMSNNEQMQLQSTALFRKLLSIERNPPIQAVIDVGVVPRLVEFLANDGNPALQFEAAWALTNIASGTSQHTEVVIHSGSVPIFVRLLQSPNDDVREQAVWAIGNIAGDSPTCRDLVLNQNALQSLLTQLQNPSSKLSMLRNATWTLANFCRGKPAPPFQLVRPALPTLGVLIHSTDADVLIDACWALSYLSDGPNEKIQSVIEQGVCARLVELLSHPNQTLQTPALRTIGNLVTGDDLQTQCVLNARVLPSLLALLSSSKRSIRKETCWTISNITAGNRDQIEAVIQANIVPQLVYQLGHSEFDIRKEACWAISNATSGGTPAQIKHIVSQGCIAPLCDLLSVSDSKVVMVALEGLENILKVGETDRRLANAPSNRMADYIEEAHGLTRLEALQEHENVEIYDKAVKILRVYFDAEEETAAAPAVQGDMYQFQAPTNGAFDFSQGLQ